MKNILSILLAVILSFGFVTPFTSCFIYAAAAPISVGDFFTWYFSAIGAVKEADENHLLNLKVDTQTLEGIKARAQVLSYFKEFQNHLPTDMTKEDMIEFLQWFESGNWSSVAEKYGDDVATYVQQQQGEFLDFIVDSIFSLFAGLESFVNALYDSNLSEYTIDENGTPSVPVEDFQKELEGTNLVLIAANMQKYSWREEEKKRPNDVTMLNFVPLYRDGISCVNTSLEDGVYTLKYVYRDGIYYYEPYQFHFYKKLVVPEASETTESAQPFVEWHRDAFSVSDSEDYFSFVDFNGADAIANGTTIDFGTCNSGAYYIGCNDVFQSEARTYSLISSLVPYFGHYPEAWSERFKIDAWFVFPENGSDTKLNTQYCYDHLAGAQEGKGSIEYSGDFNSLTTHDASCSNNCDVGFLISSLPTTKFEPTRLLSNSTITMNGDSIYDYSIIDDNTGDTTTIYKYITNNYNFPTPDTPTIPEGVTEANGSTTYTFPVKLTTNKADTIVPSAQIDLNISPATEDDLTGDTKPGIGSPVTSPAVFSNTDIFTNSSISKDAVVDFTGINFPSTGIYRYTVVESANVDGITLDTNSEHYIDVYVENADESSLKIVYYVIMTKDGTKSGGLEHQYDVYNFDLINEVTGAAGDAQKDFTFTVVFDSTTINGSNISAVKNGTDEDITVSEDMLMYTVLMSHGETVEFKNVPKGAKYTVVESNNDGYTAIIGVTGDTNNTIDDAAYKFSDINDGITADTQATYTNNKESTIPTGVTLAIATPIIVGVAAIGGVIAVVVIERKDRDDTEC